MDGIGMTQLAQESHERNIALIYFFRAFMAMDSLLLPILVPFYQSANVTFAQVAILQSVYAMTIVMFQLPTGWYADLFGRRRVLIIGSVLCLLARSLYLFGHSFETFVFAEIILGLGIASISGADFSIIYDSLALNGKTDQFAKSVARSRVGELIVCGTGAILSGYIATRYGAVAVIASGSIGFLFMIFIATRLVEPKRTVAPSNIAAMIRLCVGQIKANPAIPWCIVFFSIIYAINQPLVYLWTPFLQTTGVTIEETGWFFSGMFFWSALMGWVTPRLIRQIGEVHVLGVLLCIDVISFLGISLLVTPYVALFFLGHQTVRSSLTIVTQSMLNQHIESRVRTTMISLLSMSGFVLYSLVFVPLGQFKTSHSFQQSFMLLGAMACSALLVMVASRSVVTQSVRKVLR